MKQSNFKWVARAFQTALCTSAQRLQEEREMLSKARRLKHWYVEPMYSGRHTPISKACDVMAAYTVLVFLCFDEALVGRDAHHNIEPTSNQVLYRPKQSLNRCCTVRRYVGIAQMPRLWQHMQRNGWVRY